jgi:plastocyanin
MGIRTPVASVRGARLFINLFSNYGIMAIQLRILFCSACAIIVILACLAAGCSSHQSAATPAANPAPASSGNSVMIKGFAFSPDTLTVKPGTTVTWTNGDGTSHTVASDAGAPVAFSSDPIANGASYTFTFSQPGTYTYHCSIHPSMKGTIIVQP